MTRRKGSQPDIAESAAPEGAETEPGPFVEPVPAEPVVAADPSPEPPPPPEPPKPAPPPPPPRQSGFLAPLVGGALAGVAGFTLAHFNVLGLSAPDASTGVAALEARIADFESRQTVALDEMAGNLSSVTARLADVEARPAAEPPDLSRLDGLEDRLAAIEAMPSDGAATNAALTAKLAELERRLTALPATGSSPELQQQLEDALARLDAAEAAATDRAAQAEQAAAAAARTQALDTLVQAVTEGRPFTAELQALADPALATALEPMAATGAPTLASLQSAFPDAAREALRLSREISDQDGWTDRLVDFLASQTGARSVTPREGTSPDAILSRADFALSEGRVADALTELDTLDPALKAPLDAWIATAKTHLAANAALAAARGE